MIPALYTGIVAHLQPPECSLYPMKIDWFVHWADKKQFDAFLSMNLILITVYLSLSYFLVRTLKEKTIKKHERYVSSTLGLLNFRQPDLALIYVIVLSSGSPKIPISVFYHLLLTDFLSLEALQLAGLSARALGPASWRASRLKKS